MDRKLGVALRLQPGKTSRARPQGLRLELFQAEQRVLDAQMHAAYYRMRLSFFEDVIEKGIEQVADQRRGQREMPEALQTGSRLSKVIQEVRSFR